MNDKTEMTVFSRYRTMRNLEREQTRSNPFLADALEKEKHEGHRIAAISRTVALSAVAILLPFLNFHPSVLYYEAILIFFIAMGWLQYRMSSVGHSGTELLLILADLVLLTLVFILPNPFFDEPFPTALIYRLDNFIYYFIILAVATLAYSWRTVWAIGTWVATLWALGIILVSFFGHEVPELSVAAANAFAGYSFVIEELDPNGVQIDNRVQEIVVFVIVAGILAAKGWRSNNLLMQQANIAEERANLSRYFPSSLVDQLASSEHDIGAVRNQNVGVLFTDIVGFTRYAEQQSPEEVMELLRDYHAIVEKAIFDNGGTLEKYLGDGVMATFGTPQTSPEDAANSIHAAQQVMQAMDEFNQERREKGLQDIKVSIGVHYGTVILGDIGPSRRLEFAVLGDTVNVASRLESASRELGCRCVISNEVMKYCKQADNQDLPEREAFELRRQIKLRGRESDIDVWVA
ncbi:MAG: adenylate/guanylate cyclase domain-containing protein [Rhizobiaceae bacterium]